MGKASYVLHLPCVLLTSFRGGIRGIVELEFLRLIEQAMGKNLPIQCFFDLIVGTRCVAPFIARSDMTNLTV